MQKISRYIVLKHNQTQSLSKLLIDDDLTVTLSTENRTRRS